MNYPQCPECGEFTEFKKVNLNIEGMGETLLPEYCDRCRIKEANRQKITMFIVGFSVVLFWGFIIFYVIKFLQTKL